MGRHLAIAAALLVGALGLTASAGAADSGGIEGVATGSEVVLPAGRTVDRDYFAAAERVEIAGTINGDAHILARHILISGQINGDLLAFGATVHVTGHVAHNARILAGRLKMTGQVGRNLTVTAADIDIARDAQVQGSFVGGGATIHLEAPVARNVTVGGRTVTLAGPVGGSVNAAAGSLDIASTAEIAGTVSYLGDAPPTIHERAHIAGPVTPRTFRTLRWPWPDDLQPSWHWLGLGLLLISALSTLIAGMGMVFLFPRAVAQSVLQLGAHPAGTAGLGFLLCLVTPIAALVLLVTLVGAPLGLVLGALFLVLLYLGRIVTMVWAGQWLLSRTGATPRLITSFGIGIVVYYALRLIPVIGTVTGLLATVLGFGALMRATFQAEEPRPPAPVPRFLAQEF